MIETDSRLVDFIELNSQGIYNEDMANFNLLVDGTTTDIYYSNPKKLEEYCSS